MKRLLSLFAFCISALLAAKANDVFIAQAASGSANGSSCSSPYAYTYFNTSGNWTSGTPSGTKIGPGTTIHICGTISVAAGTEALAFQGSGTNGYPITLYFESGAVLKSPQWPRDGNGGAIDLRANSYIVVNGNGGANGATQGIIEATANGDSGAACLSGSCTYHGGSNGIGATAVANNITIEGLSIIDMYVTAPGVPNGGGATCMYDNGTITNWTITNNLMHDMGWCISFQYGGTSSGITISNNQIYNIDHGIALGSPAAGNTLTNVNIYGNNIHDYSNWDTPSNSWHHDGIHIWGYNNNGSDTITGVNIYNNKFGGCIGQNVTAHIFLETNSGNTKNVAIYNNTLIDTCNGTDNPGLLTSADPNFRIFNNTFIGSPSDTCVGTSWGSGINFINNVVSGCNELMYVTSGGGFAAGQLHNNIYANCPSSNCFAYLGNYSGSFSTWRSETGQDAAPSAYVSKADIPAAGVPHSRSPVFGAGANLTSLCTGQLAALCSDINGNARPSSGPWTVGAYSASGSSSAPQPPTGLTATVQ